MARSGKAIPQRDAFEYARSLPAQARTDTSGCYVFKCLPFGNCPISCGYLCGGPASLCWGASTIPFGFCALPLGYVGPHYLSLKQDMAVVVVDAEKKTLACYPGVGDSRTQCCTCYKLA